MQAPLDQLINENLLALVEMQNQCIADQTTALELKQDGKSQYPRTDNEALVKRYHQTHKGENNLINKIKALMLQTVPIPSDAGSSGQQYAQVAKQQPAETIAAEPKKAKLDEVSVGGHVTEVADTSVDHVTRNVEPVGAESSYSDQIENGRKAQQ